jgi:hypothetical protein
MVKKAHQNKSGGLNEAGRKHYNAKGHNLKSPVSKGKGGRRISFAARFSGMKGPMKDDKGKPTRLALALKAWGFSSKGEAASFASRNKKT